MQKQEGLKEGLVQDIPADQDQFDESVTGESTLNDWLMQNEDS